MPQCRQVHLRLSGTATTVLFCISLCLIAPADALEFLEPIRASDGQSQDLFGGGVAIDGSTLLIGAPGDDDLGPGAGAAYFYTRDGGGPGIWSEQKVNANDAQSGDAFSFSAVAIDGTTAVIGAVFEDDQGQASGAAYVFVRNLAGNWVQVQKLKASDAAESDGFGFAVAISGDEIAVGAYGDDDIVTGSGSVYLFTRTGGVFTQHQKLTAPDPSQGAAFGWSVAMEGGRLAIGSVGDANGLPVVDDAGAVYVYDQEQNGVWSFSQKLFYPDPDIDSELGFSVDLSGDTIISGAREDHHSGLDNAGAAVIWRQQPNGVWLLEAKLTAPDAAVEDELGFSVSIEGDFALIGARNADLFNQDSGAVYVYESTGTAWTFVEKLVTPDPASATPEFGTFVASAGDLVVVGARQDDVMATDAGAVYLWNREAVLGVVPGSYQGPESGGSVTVNVSRSSFTENAVSVDFATADGTALAGLDYQATAGTLNWAADDTADKAVVINLLDDADFDPGETFTLFLRDAGPGAKIGNATTSISIDDNESNPAGSLLFSTRVFSASETAGTVTVTVTRSGGSAGAVSMDYTTDETGGSSAQAGADYTPTSGTLDWADGEAGARQFMVTLLDDSDEEGDENIRLEFSAPTGGAGPFTARTIDVLIIDDEVIGEPGTISFGLDEYQGFEADGAVTLTVARAGGAGGPASASWRLLPDSAVTPGDFVDDSGVLNWADGDADPKSFTVVLVDDTEFEGDEQLQVLLSDFVGAGGGAQTSANLVITDDDTLTDLALDKTDLADPVEVGGAIQYSLAVTNLGPASADATVTDTLPAGVAFDSASGTGWSCGETGGVVTCTAVDLPLGMAPPISIVATAPGNAGSPTNTAVIAGSLPDPDPANDTAMEQTTIVDSSADLSLLKSDLADPVGLGGAVSYLLAVSNAGPAVASNVVVTDTLPGGVTFVSGSGTGWNCQESGGVVTCSRSSLAIGSAPAISIEVTAPGTDQILTNTASVAADSSDPAPGNNTDIETTTVVDDMPPQVSALHTVADTGDGSLDPGEATESAITQIYVRFDQPMNDPAGDGDPNDVTHPANYLLLDDGGDGSFDTLDCAIGADPADQPVIIDQVIYAAGTETAYLSLNGGASLPAGRYRLLACGSTGLMDPAGNLLDGDADGIGGDDYLHEFAIGTTSWIANPNFDNDLGSYSATAPTPPEISFSTEDASLAPTSGSVEMMNLSGPGGVFALSQCLPVAPERDYRFTASTRISGGDGDDPVSYLAVEFFAQPDCAGAATSSVLSIMNAGDTAGFWLGLEMLAHAPAGSSSAQLSVVVEAGAAGAFTANFDDLSFRQLGVLLIDGFE